jgi:hypothetical protein
MTRIARLSIDQIYFSTIPDKRVAEITAALDAQRANRRTAPSGSIDEDAAARNVVDLEGVLERANTNLAAHNAHLAKLEAAGDAKQQEHDARALAAITGQLRTNFMAQPGATLKEFDEILPELLREQRRQAALNAPAVREQQLAEAKRRVGAF